jgi:hypothetical protein
LAGIESKRSIIAHFSEREHQALNQKYFGFATKVPARLADKVGDMVASASMLATPTTFL